MPHIIVECTKPLTSMIDMPTMLQHIHSAMALRSDANIAETRLTSRIHVAEHAIIGDQTTSEINFICVTLLLMAGRGDEMKKSLARNIYDIVKDNLGESAHDTRVTVDVQDLSSAYTNAYTK